ncbi:MAG: heparinase II/III family protein [Alphaproteobacteria bacterium]|nr:heparinase II/III family protein [Alphaproteobacteria bacterium]
MTLLPWALLLGCAEPEPEPEAPWVQQHPGLMVTAADKERILARLDRSPYDIILEELRTSAERELRTPDPDDWDHSAHGYNGTVAQDAAFLAWLLDDPAYAEKARQAFALLEPGLEDSTDWDVNIRSVRPIMGYCNAYDLLMGMDALSEEEATEARDKLLDITDALFERYVDDDVVRQIALGVSQNNHPIRTASAIGYAALTFPDHPDAEEWSNFAVSELSYLWGPDGRYIQDDGGVSEGPFYFGFGASAALAYFIAARTTEEGGGADPDREFVRDCRNRQDVDPWAPNTCVEGERFRFENPLFGERLPAAMEWSLSLRLPDGLRPPLGDAYLYAMNGSALITGFGGPGHARWDWETVLERPYEMDHGNDLLPQHLAWVDDSEEAAPPPWTSRVLPEAGTAALRSGWDADARWLLFVAEAGAARKTLHDHADGLSFSMAAYGDYLLVDPGYYKPNTLDNAVTSAPQAHNVVLIDGEGAPDKGLLTDFGDADAFLLRQHEGLALELAGGDTEYQDTTLSRDVLFVRGRYFIVVDRLASGSGPREHAWRLGGYAGYDAGHVFELHTDGATWEREQGGVRVYLAATAEGLSVQEPPLVEGEAPHVHEFDLERTVGHHGVIDGVVQAEAPGFLAVLAPYAVGEAGARGPLEVEALDLGPGLAGWRVEGADGVDHVVLREAGAAESFTLPSGEAVTLTADAALWGEGLAALLGPGSLSVDGLTRASGFETVNVEE